VCIFVRFLLLLLLVVVVVVVFSLLLFFGGVPDVVLVRHTSTMVLQLMVFLSLWMEQCQWMDTGWTLDGHSRGT